jgi:hypothetical protein
LEEDELHPLNLMEEEAIEMVIAQSGSLSVMASLSNCGPPR